MQSKTLKAWDNKKFQRGQYAAQKIWHQLVGSLQSICCVSPLRLVLMKLHPRHIQPVKVRFVRALLEVYIGCIAREQQLTEIISLWSESLGGK